MGLTQRSDGERAEALLRQAGFVNVEVKCFKTPIGRWPKDGRLKEVGSFNYVALRDGMSGRIYRPLGKIGMALLEIEVNLALQRNALPKLLHECHSYFNL